MHFSRRLLVAVVLSLTALLFTSPVAQAQTYQRIYEANVGDNPNGELIQAPDGNYYGTTYSGGASAQGTVFRVSPTGVLTTVVSFTGANGASPIGGLVRGADGNFYGTTNEGGVEGNGTIFKMTPAGVLTTLYHFQGSANGRAPAAWLVPGPDGSFYGTTMDGGTDGYGTIFKVTPAGVLTTLAVLSPAKGWEVSRLILGADGNFYGTTVAGGVRDEGTVFRLTPAGVMTTLLSFNSAINGAGPIEPLISAGSDGFYGTTSSGGLNGAGTIFKISTAGMLTTLVAFNGSDGVNPGSLLRGSDGNVYGATFGDGGENHGTVFKMTPAGVLTTLVTFDGTNGSGPVSLVEGPAGTFHGTTFGGGGNATAFKVTSSGTFTPLDSFGGDSFPQSYLLRGSDGAFYGTTVDGGVNGAGTLFKVTPAGALVIIAHFGAPDGGEPGGGLTQGTDGNFYGGSWSGGADNYGTIFKVTPAGVLTTLASLSDSSGYMPQRLVQGADGNFYGTARFGGVSQGTVTGSGGAFFRITPAGVYTRLLAFAAATGERPNDLIKASDGDFYGTTSHGGENGYGTIFRISAAGSLTTRHSFTASSGRVPLTGLVQASDDNFYGTTSEGGANNLGTVFRISPGGAFTTLASLTTDTRGAAGSLVQAGDGNFYGLSGSGGTNANGAIFKITPTGTLSTLVSFGLNTANPAGGLTVGADGNLYGNVTYGGAHDAGAVFKVTLAGELTLLHSFNGTREAMPASRPIFATDGKLYGTASEMVIWRLGLTASAPTVATGDALGISTTAATLQGTVAANGASTTVTFEYGLTSGYGQTIAAEPATVTGTDEVNVSATLGGLAPGSTYHFRVVATNAQGTTFGADKTFKTAGSGSSGNAPTITLEPISERGLSAGSGVVFQVSASGAGPLKYQWFKDGAAIRGATSATLAVNAVTAASAGSYWCVISNSGGKVKSATALITVTDPGLLIYKVSGRGLAHEGTAKTKAAVGGYLVLDRVGQRAALLWTAKEKRQKVYWIEQRPDVATHSTGPVPKSTTAVVGEMAEGSHPNIARDIVWLKGADALIKLSSLDQTVAPPVLAGTVNRLRLGSEPTIETLSLSLVLDKAVSMTSRAASDELDEALARLKHALEASGYQPRVP